MIFHRMAIKETIESGSDALTVDLYRRHSERQ
jgi:hypothetical protein